MLARLDAFEGNWYQRVAVTVETDAGRVRASTYVLSPCARRRATDAAWSLADFMTRDRLRFTRYWRDRSRRQVPPRCRRPRPAYAAAQARRTMLAVVHRSREQHNAGRRR